MRIASLTASARFQPCFAAVASKLSSSDSGRLNAIVTLRLSGSIAFRPAPDRFPPCLVFAIFLSFENIIEIQVDFINLNNDN
jgi:hypothetical protein